MKTTNNCLLDYGMQRNEGVMENVIVYVLNARDLRGEVYWSQKPQNIAGNMDRMRGERISSICRFSIINIIIFIFLYNCMYYFFSYINVYLLMFPCIYIKWKTAYSMSSTGSAFRTSSRSGSWSVYV